MVGGAVLIRNGGEPENEATGLGPAWWTTIKRLTVLHWFSITRRPACRRNYAARSFSELTDQWIASHMCDFLDWVCAWSMKLHFVNSLQSKSWDGPWSCGNFDSHTTSQKTFRFAYGGDFIQTYLSLNVPNNCVYTRPKTSRFDEKKSCLPGALRFDQSTPTFLFLRCLACPLLAILTPLKQVTIQNAFIRCANWDWCNVHCSALTLFHLLRHPSNSRTHPVARTVDIQHSLLHTATSLFHPVLQFLLSSLFLIN